MCDFINNFMKHFQLLKLHILYFIKHLFSLIWAPKLDNFNQVFYKVKIVAVFDYLRLFDAIIIIIMIRLVCVYLL